MAWQSAHRLRTVREARAQDWTVFLLVTNRQKMNSTLAALAKKAAQRLGIEIRPTSLRTRFDLRIKYLINTKRPDYILDIGANVGQFARSVFQLGYTGRIISFEPLPDIHAQLREAAERHGPNWIVAPCCALSDVEGETEFHVTSSRAASSMLPISTHGAASYDLLKEEAVIRVQTRRLDALLDSMNLSSALAQPFLKIDVQGAEHKVLTGAPETLRNVIVLICEMPFVSFYEGQADWRAVDRMIASVGLDLWDIEPFLRSGASGRVEHADFVYVRPSTSTAA
ncbi:MAG: FkbM family methyltransferase [Mesorhizobium sp.]|nr:MAG: FkbM family methyltransferase [Mesorhizobium sp.]